MTLYFLIKTLHILSAAVLFGTGLGIAFFMLRGRFDDHPAARFFAARNTVLADYLFTAPAVLVQPASGLWLILNGGYRWDESWLLASYGFYALAGACWLPVVWIQIRLKKMAAASMMSGSPPPPAFDRLLRVWFVLGWPAFLGLVVVYFLMVAKPG